jgi:dCMP deaminase
MKKTISKTEKYKRPTWDEYFLQMADLVGSRGTCDRGRAGAVIARDKRIVATGYAGSPVGLPHCDEVGHEMHKVTHEDGTTSRHCIRTAHAEMNAITNAARVGVAVEGATLYCKFLPCYTCAKAIINAGIKRVVSLRDYHATKETKNVFKKAGIKMEIIKKEVQFYKDQ